MWKIRVQAHPASVTAAVKSGDLVPQFLWRFPLEAHVALAAKLDRGVTYIDADQLLPAGAQAPKLSSGEGRCGDARLRGRADRE